MNDATRKPDQILTLERFLPYRLSILSNQVSRTVAQAYEDRFGLSISEWRIMAILGEYPGVSADEVCQRTQMEKSIVSRAVSRLLNRNLIHRSIDDNDRRRSCLNLTTVGIDVYNEIVPLSYQYEADLQSCLSETEREQFDQLVDKLYRHASTRALGDNSE